MSSIIFNIEQNKFKFSPLLAEKLLCRQDSATSPQHHKSVIAIGKAPKIPCATTSLAGLIAAAIGVDIEDVFIPKILFIEYTVH